MTSSVSSSQEPTEPGQPCRGDNCPQPHCDPRDPACGCQGGQCPPSGGHVTYSMTSSVSSNEPTEPGQPCRGSNCQPRCNPQDPGCSQGCQGGQCPSGGHQVPSQPRCSPQDPRCQSGIHSSVQGQEIRPIYRPIEQPKIYVQPSTDLQPPYPPRDNKTYVIYPQRPNVTHHWISNTDEISEPSYSHNVQTNGTRYQPGGSQFDPIYTRPTDFDDQKKFNRSRTNIQRIPPRGKF